MMRFVVVAEFWGQSRRSIEYATLIEAQSVKAVFDSFGIVATIEQATGR